MDTLCIAVVYTAGTLRALTAGMKTRNARPSATYSIRSIGGTYQVVTKIGPLVASIIACDTYSDALAAAVMVRS